MALGGGGGGRETGGGGGGGGGIAAGYLPGLTAFPELPRRLNEKYDPRCSSGLLGVPPLDEIEPDLGDLGVRGDPIRGRCRPISRRRAFHPGVA